MSPRGPETPQPHHENHPRSRRLSPDQIFQKWRQRKTSEFFREHNIDVKVFGTVPEQGLIVATHPTVDDTAVTRISLPKGMLLVNAPALEKTGVDTIDQLFSWYVSNMIPVYTDPAKRGTTYRRSADALHSGRPVVIAPTGTVTGSEAIPTADQLKMNGTMRILQEAGDQRHIIPMVRHVPQASIDTATGRILPNAHVSVYFGEPVAVPKALFEPNLDWDAVAQEFARQVVAGWERAVQQHAAE